MLVGIALNGVELGVTRLDLGNKLGELAVGNPPVEDNRVVFNIHDLAIAVRDMGEHNAAEVLATLRELYTVDCAVAHLVGMATCHPVAAGVERDKLLVDVVAHVREHHNEVHIVLQRGTHIVGRLNVIRKTELLVDLLLTQRMAAIVGVDNTHKGHLKLAKLEAYDRLEGHLFSKR